MSIAILGGGNGAHAAAADLTLRGFEVHMYEDEQFAGNMQKVFDSREITIKGACGNTTVEVAMVTSNLEKAIEGVTHIIAAVPAFAHQSYAEKLASVVKPGQTIFLTPGTFGSLIFWKKLKEANNTDGIVIAETNTLPYAARLTAPGEVLVMSRFNPLKVGVMPAEKTEETVKDLSRFFDGLKPSESVIACGLSSLNPIIHVPGCIMNAGRIEYAKGEFFFYTEGFTSCVVRATEAVDAERINLLNHFGYESDIVAHGIGGGVITDDLHEAIAGNESFAKIKGPADTKNRYYSEDIPYGIALWAKLAHQLGVKTPMMDAMVNIGTVVLEKDCWNSGHQLDELGISSMEIEELKQYVTRG